MVEPQSGTTSGRKSLAQRRGPWWRDVVPRKAAAMLRLLHRGLLRFRRPLLSGCQPSKIEGLRAALAGLFKSRLDDIPDGAA